MNATDKEKQGNRSRSSADDLLALHLAGGKTLQDAAAAAGVSPSTASRRMEDKAFRTNVRQLRSQIIADTISRLSAMGLQAADKLHDLLSAKAETTQLAAARTILEYSIKGIDHTLLPEIENELDALSQQEQGKTNGASKAAR